MEQNSTVKMCLFALWKLLFHTQYLVQADSAEFKSFNFVVGSTFCVSLILTQRAEKVEDFSTRPLPEWKDLEKEVSGYHTGSKKTEYSHSSPISAIETR